MGKILRTGLGTKKLVIVIPLGKKEFKPILEEPSPRGTIKVEKTNSSPVNNRNLIEQYRFGYYDENGDLKSYLLGNPFGERDFYLQEMRNMSLGPSAHTSPLKLITGKARIRLSNILGVGIQKNNGHGPAFERSLFYLWNFTKGYLKEAGVERLITQAEFELIDTAEIDMKLGWRDIDRTRRLEQYVGNKAERKKHLTIPERVCGTIYLEYPLNVD